MLGWVLASPYRHSDLPLISRLACAMLNMETK